MNPATVLPEKKILIIAAQSLPRLSLLSAVVILAATIAVSAYLWRLEASLQRLRDDTLAQVERQAVQLADVIAGNAEATIRTVDFALIHLATEYAERRDIDGDVRSVYDSFPANTVAQIGVIDADGYLVWSSVGVKERVYLGDREHFKAHLGTEANRLFISRPVLGRASGVWSIQYSRPIRHHGKFAGVMVISLLPTFLANQGALTLGAGDVVALIRPDGSYLARIPKLDDAMGKSVPETRPFVGEKAMDHGTFRAVAAFDAVQRTFAWRRLQALPVTVVIGLDEAATLGAVERETNVARQRAVAGSIVVLLLAAGLALLLLRAARLQRAIAASELRHRGIFEKNTSVHLLIDPADGRIVEANPAATAFYGYPHDTLLKMRITDINCLPADEVTAEMRKAEAEQRMYFNFRHRLADGQVRDVEVYSGPVEINGRTLLFSIIHDVTTRHELERKLAYSEELHRSLFTAMAEGVIVVRRDGSISAWNEAALAILGVDADELKAHRTICLDAEGQLLEPEHLPSSRAARGEQLDHELFCIQRPDKTRTWITVSSRSLRTGDMADAAVLSFSDITRLVEAEESLRLAESVFQVAGEGIVVTDADNRIIAVNPAFTTLTGYSAREVIGRNPSLLASGLHDQAFYLAMWQCLIRDGHWEGEISNRRKDGRIYVEWLRLTVIPERPGHGRRYVALFSDVTDRKREAEAIWRQANFDPLTDLPNRKLLEDRLQRAIAQAHRKHSSVAVLFIDLDRFKPINDEFGHAMGDELLRQVARRLDHCLRDEDTVARLGGDEFVAVLPDLRIAEAPAKAADKILAILSEPFRLGDRYAEISCSIGIAQFPHDADNAPALIACADAAMYAAKEAGRGTWSTSR